MEWLKVGYNPFLENVDEDFCLQKLLARNGIIVQRKKQVNEQSLSLNFPNAPISIFQALIENSE